jgi:glycosyltransferase 2 family protein
VRHWLRQIVSIAVGLAAIGALVLVVDPVKVGQALAHFQVGLVPLIIVLWLVIYALQGIRWHFLLLDAGARLSLRDSILLNAAGQTITALVPLGDLTRALFASEATGRDFGTLAATVTVQELTFTLMLILCALPMLFAVHLGALLVALTLVGMAAIVVVLIVSPVFCMVHAAIARIPLINKLLPAIDELQEETAHLLHRPDTLVLSILDLARAVVSIVVFWLVVQGLAPGMLDLPRAALILALATVGGAVSLIPGGVGANEASVAGLLVVFGIPPGAAAAAALIQRFLMTGMAIVLGLSSYAIARRRFRLGGVFQITTREPPAQMAG